jgi:hypothetical protein
MLMLKEKLARAQHKMKAYADTLRTDRQFQIGDQVLLKLQLYVQHSVVRRPFPKLSFKFFGPYRVLEKIGNTAYKLQLPEGSLIHPVFHVSQLKPFHPDHSPVFSDITKIVDLSARELQPERVLERRLVKKGNNDVPQALIKWRGLPATLATWEDWYVVQAKFPSASAWGQALSPGEEDVVPLQYGATDEEKTDSIEAVSSE